MNKQAQEYFDDWLELMKETHDLDRPAQEGPCEKNERSADENI